jgi:hypothetical protein
MLLLSVQEAAYLYAHYKDMVSSVKRCVVGSVDVQVGAFNQSRPLNARNWDSALRAHSVVIATAGLIRNVIDDLSDAVLNDVALLVSTPCCCAPHTVIMIVHL